MDIALFEYGKSCLKRNVEKSVVWIWPMVFIRIEGVIYSALYGYDDKENVNKLSNLKRSMCTSPRGKL